MPAGWTELEAPKSAEELEALSSIPRSIQSPVPATTFAPTLAVKLLIEPVAVQLLLETIGVKTPFIFGNPAEM